MISASHPNSDRYRIADPPATGSLSVEFGLAVGLLGIALTIPVVVVGRLFVGELLLAVLFPFCFIAMASRGGAFRQLAFWLLLGIAVALFGYVNSDMFRDTARNDYLRGWFRLLFLASNFVGIAWIVRRDIRALYYLVLGYSLGTMLSPLVVSSWRSQGIVSSWKFIFSFPVAIGIVILLRHRRPAVIVSALVGVAILSAVLDSRSMAILCMLTAGVLLVSHRRSMRNPVRRARPSRVGLLMWSGAVMVACAVLVTFFIIRYGRTESNAQRYDHVGAARIAFATVTWEAICDSPWVGYGSNPKDWRLARAQDRMVKATTGGKIRRTKNSSRDSGIIAHSQILQAWLEGGILAIGFFVLYGVQISAQFLYVVLRRPYDALTPLVTFLLVTSGWHLLFSPFKGETRVLIAIACVVLCYLFEESVRTRNAGPKAGKTRAAWEV